jgi:hypothetical protein
MGKHVGKLSLGCAVLTAVAITLVPGASSATTHRAQAAPKVSVPLSSLAIVPGSKTSIDVAGGVNTGPATSTTTVNGLATGVGEGVRGTAVTPDGALALSVGYGTHLESVSNPRTAPAVGPSLDLSQFSVESDPLFTTKTSGVSLTPDGRYGLVGIGAPGLVAIARNGASYAVDTRVHSAGTNRLGNPHTAGFVTVPTVGDGADSYDGTVISDTPASNGHYLGLTIDAGVGTVAVITGVGTSGAAMSGFLQSSTICDRPTATCYGGIGYGYGNGGMAFSPTTATKAVIATNNGVSVLYLGNPANPTLGSATVIPEATGGNGASSVAVAPDGNHVVVAVNSTLYFFSGLAGATPGAPLTQSATPITMPGFVRSVAVTRSGNLVVNYTPTASTGDLAVITGMETASPSRNAATDLPLSGPGATTNDMSVWPAVGAPQGYRLTGGDGGVYSFNAPFYGSTGNLTLSQPVVAMSSAPDLKGYYFVARDGGVFAYGSAKFQGSVPGAGVHVGNIAAMAADPATGGYWVVGNDGGVYSFNAPFFGSLPKQGVTVSDIVGMAATPDGGGYYLVARDGGVFTFGDASFAGSMGGHPLNHPVVGMALDPATGGYWEVASDGGVFSFNAPFFGSTGNIALDQPVVGMTPTLDGQGYWFAAADGGIFSFGDASFEGSLPSRGITPNMPIIGMTGA